MALILVCAPALAACGGGRQDAVNNVPAVASQASTPARAGSPRQGAQPQLFSPDSFWNKPLPAAAKEAPNSGALVASLLRMVDRELIRKFGPWISTTGFSTPIYAVPASQPTVRVVLDNNNPALQAAFEQVPVPPNARAADGEDAQMTVWQAATDRLWEFWHMHRVAGEWHAQWGGAMQAVSHSPGYFDAQSWPGAQSYWGATATSLPLVGGLMRISELQRGQINHALALGLPQTRAGDVVWPAQRSDGNTVSPDAIPEGTRFRIDPSLNLEALHLPPLTLMMARAVQTYGMVVRDTSGVVDFYAEDPTPTGSDPYSALFGNEFRWQLLAVFPWNHLRVVEPNA